MGSASKKVAVVVSTYNGHDYVTDQLKSVVEQQGVDLEIFVRDDGSSDDTVALIESFAETTSVPIHVERGENCGVTESFMRALASVPQEFPYISLCDQDDVWLPNKLERAISLLEPLDQTKPLLYCADYYFCDEQMHRGEASHHNRIGITPSNTLFEVISSGNTIVVNRMLVDMMDEHGWAGAYCHDWWLALIATHFGTVVFDNEPCLDYRRTGSNASPTGMNPLKLLVYRFKNFIAGDQFACINAQNQAFLAHYGELLSDEQRRVLQVFTTGPRRFKVTYPHRLRQKGADEISLRLLLLLGY